MASLLWLQRLLFDAAIVIAIAVVTTNFRSFVTPTKQGFTCHDPRLQQPFNTEGEAISQGVVYGVGFGVPAGLIVLIECFYVLKNKKQNGDSWLPLLQKSFEGIVPFFFGGAVGHLTVNILKYSIGRLRPHFFDVCKPDWSRVNCTNNEYITEDICTETSESRVNNARVSFPSSQGCMSMYFMLYLILYLQRRVKCSGCSLFLPLIQIGLIYMAFYSGITRMHPDGIHHWEDILAAGFLGGFIAILTFWKIRPSYTPSGVSESYTLETEPEIVAPKNSGN